MPRIKHAVKTHKRKKRLLKRAKGMFGQRKSRYQQAKRTLIKAMVYSYRDRRVKKREMKKLWIIRINAACRSHGMMYSRFIKGLINAKVGIDRKILSEIAIHSPETFKKLVELAKTNLN